MKTRMKNILFIILLLFGISSFAQSESEANETLKAVSSLDQVDSLKQAHPDWYVTITKTLPLGFTYDSLLFNANIGEIILTQWSTNAPKFQRKVISKGTIEVCKVSYIYLDGKKHKLSEIKNIQKQIIAQYNNGTSFLDLVKKYNEEGNPTGELNWFYKGMMDDDFDKSVREKSAGNIFTVDVPKRYWYYVVLKSEENKILECTYSVGIKIGT